jgi:HAD superfamily hydrolase (TIGR01509 family)
MMASSRLAVVFDLDGTLIDTETIYRSAFIEAAKGFGVAVRADFYNALLGISSRERVPLLGREFGPAFPVEAFFARYRERRAALLPSRIPLRPGVSELLRRLALPMAVATSASRTTAHSHLRRAGLAHHFELVVTRDDVLRGKPAPDAFLQAAERLGVAPEHCVAVEDSANGVAAALGAGMQVLMVADTIPPELRGHCAASGPDLLAVMEWLAPAAAPERERETLRP